MKHKATIIFILLSMFIITQFIGLYVVHHYAQEGNKLPYGMQSPELKENKDFYSVFPSIVIAFVIAIVLFFLLTKFKIEFILRIWFLIVVIVALGISFNAFFSKLPNVVLLSTLLAVPLAVIKIFGKNIMIHNVTELLIYPGIAAVFVPLLNVWTVLALLILISFYDMWAVWKSKIMQKMAKFQMNQVKVFPGFFVPYLSKKQKQKIRKLKRTLKKSELKNKKIKVNTAILGGGDIIFPIITAGVVLVSSIQGRLPGFFSSFATPLFGVKGLGAAIYVLFGATLGLGYLFLFSKKKKFYPAMPFITMGIIFGLLTKFLVNWIFKV